MKVRAKFTVTGVTYFGHAGPKGEPMKSLCWGKDGKPTDVPQRKIQMQPVCDNSSEENRSFAAATPSGSIEFLLNNPDCAAEFQVGSTYYVEFEQANQ